MTDRIKAYLVILEEDIREDDAADVTVALGQIKHVIEVRKYVAAFSTDATVAEARVRKELSDKLFEVLYPDD